MFVFNPTNVDTSEEKSAFKLPTPTPSSAPVVKDGTQREPKESLAKLSPELSGVKAASPFIPGGNNRARQPSPLRQVETVNEPEPRVQVEEKPKAEVAPPKPFAGFSFGIPASTTPSLTTVSTPAVVPPTPPRTVSFGSSGSPKSGASFSFGAAKTPPKPFNPGTGFSFGSGGSSSIFGGNGTGLAFEVGRDSVPHFSFGAGAKPATGSAPPASASTSAFSGFSFKANTPAEVGNSTNSTPTTSVNGMPATEEAREDEEAVEEVEEVPDNTLLNGGAGEEDEETIYEGRAKLWRHESRNGGAAKEFVEHGISIVKLKRHESTGKVRMLGRSDANGRVQIVRLY